MHRGMDTKGRALGASFSSTCLIPVLEEGEQCTALGAGTRAACTLVTLNSFSSPSPPHGPVIVEIVEQGETGRFSVASASGAHGSREQWPGKRNALPSSFLRALALHEADVKNSWDSLSGFLTKAFLTKQPGPPLPLINAAAC